MPNDEYLNEFSKHVKQCAEDINHVERMFSAMILELNGFPTFQQANSFLEKTAKKMAKISAEPVFPECKKCASTGVVFFYDTAEHREMTFLCDCKMGQYLASIRRGFAHAPASVLSDERYFKGSKNQYNRSLLFTNK